MLKVNPNYIPNRPRGGFFVPKFEATSMLTLKALYLNRPRDGFFISKNQRNLTGFGLHSITTLEVVFLWKIIMKISTCQLLVLLKNVNLSHSTIFKLVDVGLSSAQTSLDIGASEWSQEEFQLVVEAIFTAKTDDEIEALVIKLIQDRQSDIALDAVTSELNNPFFARKQYIVQNFIPNMGTSVLSGENGHLNVCLAVELSLHIASGLKWHNHNINQTTPVYCTNLHRAADFMTMREQWEKKHQIKADFPFYISTKPLNLFSKAQRGEWIKSFYDYMLYRKKEQFPGLFVIEIQDTMFGKALNIKRASELARCADAFREEIGASVLFVFNKGIDSSNANYRHLLSDVNYAAYIEQIPHSNHVRLTWPLENGHTSLESINIQLSCNPCKKC